MVVSTATNMEASMALHSQPSSPIPMDSLPSPNLTEAPHSPTKFEGSPQSHIPKSQTHAQHSKAFNITEYSNPQMRAMKKRCRTVMTPTQSRILRKVLEQTAFPSTEVRENLAKVLGMKPRTVQIWFQNQRQKCRMGSGGMSPNSAIPGSPSSASSPVTLSPSESMLSFSSINDHSADPNGPAHAHGNHTAHQSTSSPSMSSPSSSISPTLTAAAVISGNHSQQSQPQMQPQPQMSFSQQHSLLNTFERYSKFHGPVFKSLPGGTSSNGGNTAAAIQSKRLATAAAAAMMGYSSSNFAIQKTPSMASPIPTAATLSCHGHNGISLPSLPQHVPNLPSNASCAQPSLDVLASVVSNFRPNGYDYWPSHQGKPIMTPSNSLQLPPISSPSNSNLTVHPISNSNNGNLPSLRDLAQVASLVTTTCNEKAPRRPW